MSTRRHLQPIPLDGGPPDIKAALRKIEQQKKDTLEAKKNKKLREKQALEEAKRQNTVLKTPEELQAETATMDRYTSMVAMARVNSKYEAKKKRHRMSESNRSSALSNRSQRSQPSFTGRRPATADGGSTDDVASLDKASGGDMDSGATSNTSASNYRTTTPTIAEELGEDDYGSASGKNGDDDDTSEADDVGSSGKQKPSEEEIEEFTSARLSWYNPIRRLCGKIVTNERFQFFIVGLIILNSVEMGLATYDFIDANPPVNYAFTMVDNAFLVVFTIECGLNLGYYGYKLFFDGWLVFDLLVVIMSWAMDGVQIFRSFRIFRALRLVAKLDVLKDLVAAIVAVLPRIGSIMMLFFLVLYIYAVLCTVLFGPYRYGDDGMNYFGRLDYSLFTLFQYITLDNWGAVSRDVMDLFPWAAAVFLSFLCVSSFILYSLVVAVVCDAVAVMEHPDIAVNLFKENMKTEKHETQERIARLEKKVDGLSRQQMGVLLSVQAVLVDLQDREITKRGRLRTSTADQDIDNTTRSEPASLGSRKSFRSSLKGAPWRKTRTR